MPIDHTLLAGLKFFALYDDEDRQAFSKVVDKIHLSSGKILFEKGDPGDALFIVLSGRIELFIRNVTGEKFVLTVAERDDFFGELSIADKRPRTATAVALEDADLIVLNRDNLRMFFQRRPDAALDLIAAMATMIRNADAILNRQVSRNVNVEMQEIITPFQRAADWIAWFSGGLPFLIINIVWFAGWVLINTVNVGIPRFDPYPFGLLTMIVSLEAIFLSIFVLISQNRQAEKDRVRSEIDYEVNVKAELEIAHLHDKTDRLQEKILEQFARLERSITDRDVVRK
jgi:CRP/FNR family transcriptional regulator, cyclic AMP receptor protein